jgi:tetratricopeptide (TPR) repeat protein
MYEKALGPDHPGVATSLNNLAVLYQEMGRPADAEPLARRALTIREKAYGANSPQLLNTIHNLAELYRTLGRNADADALNKRAEAIKQRSK